jgi:hypothetical protein
MVMFMTLGLQMYMIYFVRQLMTSKAVNSIRHVYSLYEKAMYPNHTTIVFRGGVGYHRGVDGFLVSANFDLLSDDDKEQICEIPLSEPYFLFAVLLIWTMTCMEQIRSTEIRFRSMIWETKTVTKMSEGVRGDEDSKKQLITGLTRLVKAMLVVTVFFPQVLITCVLLWLGCRWLCATNDLGELLLNAVALEFILQLKDLIYNVLVPVRAKMEVQNTFIDNTRDPKYVASSFASFFLDYLWGLGSVLFTAMYMCFFQNVLPNYNWDIRDMCDVFLRKQRIV